MKTLTASEVYDLKKTLPERRSGELAYAKEVNALKPGEGFTIGVHEWNRKTSVSGYFTVKFNVAGKRVVKTEKLEDGLHLIVKL